MSQPKGTTCKGAAAATAAYVSKEKRAILILELMSCHHALVQPALGILISTTLFFLICQIKLVDPCDGPPNAPRCNPWLHLRGSLVYHTLHQSIGGVDRIYGSIIHNTWGLCICGYDFSFSSRATRHCGKWMVGYSSWINIHIEKRVAPSRGILFVHEGSYNLQSFSLSC